MEYKKNYIKEEPAPLCTTLFKKKKNIRNTLILLQHFQLEFDFQFYILWLVLLFGYYCTLAQLNCSFSRLYILYCCCICTSIPCLLVFIRQEVCFLREIINLIIWQKNRRSEKLYHRQIVNSKNGNKNKIK